MPIHPQPTSTTALSAKTSSVPDVGDLPPEFFPGPFDVNDDGVRHTARKFAEQYGPGEFGATISRLHRHYERDNADLFDSALPIDPLILIGPHRGAGWYAYRSQVGGQHEIGISTKCFSNSNKYLKRTDETERGFMKFVDDIFLHEMVHLYNTFVCNKPETSYHGHGPEFAQTCNEVGSKLNLPPVRSCRNRSRKSSHMPSCSDWPSCVRPEGYYEGAWVAADPEEDEVLSRDEKADRAFQYLRRVCERCDPSPVHLGLMGQAAVIACRLRFGPLILPRHSTEIPFSEFCTI